MRVIGGAIVILAGSVMVAGGAVGQAVQLLAGGQANIHLSSIEALMPLGALLSMIGLVLLVSGFWENRGPKEPRL